MSRVITSAEKPFAFALLSRETVTSSDLGLDSCKKKDYGRGTEGVDIPVKLVPSVSTTVLSSNLVHAPRGDCA